MASDAPRYRIEWAVTAGHLVALEPTPEEVAAHAPALSVAYNDPHNHAMMSNDTHMSAEDVADHFSALAAAGARNFLLFHDGALAGDADVRRITAAGGEFAILIAARAAQGRGLGTAFARMVHVFAFRTVGLDRLYVTILPTNAASLRLFEKLGYLPDDSPEARAHADDASDLCLSLARADFDDGLARGVTVTRR